MRGTSLNRKGSSVQKTVLKSRRRGYVTTRDYTVVEEDRLDKICQKIFGNRFSLGLRGIIRANPDWDGNMIIPAGRVLKIPRNIILDVIEDEPVDVVARSYLG